MKKKPITTIIKNGRRYYRVFIKGMVEPSYHRHIEEAIWAAKLRGCTLGASHGQLSRWA